MEFWQMEMATNNEWRIMHKHAMINRTIYVKYGNDYHDSYVDHESIPLTSIMCPNIPVPFKMRNEKFKIRSLADVLKDLTDD
jgi:hypothetical protein